MIEDIFKVSEEELRTFEKESFIRGRDCNEKYEIKFYCTEFDNFYCPRICHYARFKEKFEKRRKL